MSDQWCTSYKRLFWVTFAAWSLITSRCSWVAASCGGILKSTWMCLLWNACETESPTVPILSQPVKSSPIFPTCSPHFILCDLSGLGSESYPTMQLTSTSGSRGNGERGHFKGLSGIQRIEKQLRSTVKVSPYPNRCDTTPLVPHARALVPLVYSSTPLHLQPHLPPIAPPLQERAASAKILLPSALAWHVSVCLSHPHTRLLTHCFAHTHSCTGGAHFSPFQADPPVLHPFFPLTHTIWSMSLLSLTVQYPCRASALVKSALPVIHSSW